VAPLPDRSTRGNGFPVRPPGKRDREDKGEPDPALEGNIASAGELEPGDRVVYPNQGVCRVLGLEQKDIAGQRLEFVKLTREEDGASVLVPLQKVATIGLRRVASADQIEGVFHYLGASYDDPELDWKVRHRDNVERLIAGGVLGVAEVVKGLHSLARLRPLPAKERELYDGSRHLLVSEVAVSLGIPATIAEDYIDYALMPPAGVKLPLKPPPKPVELKGPPWKRKKPVSEEDDLGLEDLGLDLGSLEGEEPAAENAEGAAGEGAERTETASAGEEAVATPRPARPAKPEKKAARPPVAEKERKKAPKAHPKKAAKKPAPRNAAKKPAKAKPAKPPKKASGGKRK